MSTKNTDQISIDDVLSAASGSEEVQSIKTATKRAGRPRQKEERATERLVIYLTPGQLEEIEEHCFTTKQKVSTFVKDVFFEAFKGEKRKANAVGRFIDRLDEKELGMVVKEYLKSK